MPLWLPALPDHRSQPGGEFKQSGWELLTPSQSSPATSPSRHPRPPLCSAEKKESTLISPKHALVWVLASPGLEPVMPRPLGCSPLASRMKPGCPWGWTLKPHCYKPWSCWGAAMPRGGCGDIPEQHPLVSGWKRAESGPDGDRTPRSQSALDPVPRSPPTASTPIFVAPKSRNELANDAGCPAEPGDADLLRLLPGSPGLACVARGSSAKLGKWGGLA